MGAGKREGERMRESETHVVRPIGGRDEGLHVGRDRGDVGGRHGERVKAVGEVGEERNGGESEDECDGGREAGENEGASFQGPADRSAAQCHQSLVSQKGRRRRRRTRRREVERE